MHRNFPRKTLTFHPDAWRFILRYAEIRAIPKATAISELLLYVFMGDKCPTNPKVIEDVVSTIREESDMRGRA